MAATKAVAGYGTSLDIGGTNVPYTITNVRDVGGPTMSRTSIDISSVNTAAQATATGYVQGFKEFAPGMADMGETRVSMAIPPDSIFPTTHPFYYGAQTVTLTFPTSDAGNTALVGANFACSGFATGWEVGDPYEDAQTADLTIKWSGIPTFTDEA